MGGTFSQNRNPIGPQCDFDKVLDYWSKEHVRCWFQAKVTIDGKRYCNRHAPIVMRGGKIAQVVTTLIDVEAERFFEVAACRGELPNEVVGKLIREYVAEHEKEEA